VLGLKETNFQKSNRFWELVLFISLGDATASDDKKKMKINVKDAILILLYFCPSTK